MTYKVIISSRAEIDIADAIEFYQEIRPSLPREFLAEVKAARRYLQKNPKKFQVRYSNVRIAFLKKFPFGIHYLIDKKSIIILSVFHTSRNSDDWLI